MGLFYEMWRIKNPKNGLKLQNQLTHLGAFGWQGVRLTPSISLKDLKSNVGPLNAETGGGGQRTA